jgi:hypothetical protein
MLSWLTRERAGPAGESGGLSVGKVGECDVKSRYL